MAMLNNQRVYIYIYICWRGTSFFNPSFLQLYLGGVVCSPPVCEFWFESTWLKYTSTYLCLFHCFPGFGAPTFTTRLFEVQPEFVSFCPLSKMAQSGFRGIQLRNTMSAFMPKLASAWEEEGVVSAWGYKIWVMVMGPRQVPRSPGVPWHG